MQKIIQENLIQLLDIASPTGYTDNITEHVQAKMSAMGYATTLTNRGALICHVGRKQGASINNNPAQRAILAHLDTLGAMVSQIESNGTIRLTALGSWSSRFAEGARVSLISDNQIFRGTILPEKASGHVYGPEIDSQPVAWTQLRLRLDARIHNQSDVLALGIRIGDIVAVDPCYEFLDNGFINSRYLDDKAAVAVILSVLSQNDFSHSVPCDIILTVTEEIGTGAQHTVSNYIKECLALDISTADKSQNTCEGGITFVYKDASGPYDRQLTRKLENLCQQHQIPYTRDVFRFYSSDASAAIKAGHDIRCALACFETDASHGYERTHMDSLLALAKLTEAYLLETVSVLV